MVSQLSTLLLVGVCLVLITGLLTQELEQEAELRSPATLQCKKKTGFRDCTWNVDTDASLILKSTYHDLYPEGYSLNFDANAGTCSLQIDAVKAEDMGKWSCVLDITRHDVKLIVTKRPEENKLKYNEQIVNNGASVGVVPDTEGKVKVVCESKYGLPRPSITWRVDKQYASDEDIIFTDEGGSATDGFHVKSVLTLKYPTEEQPMGYRVPERNPHLQKEVYCTIKYSKDEAKAIELHAVFGEEGELVNDDSLKTVDGAAVTLPCRSAHFNVSDRQAYVQTLGRSNYGSVDRVRDSFDKLCFWIHDDTTTVFSHRPSATPEYQIISDVGKALQCDLLIQRVRKEHQGDWYCTRGRHPRQKVQLKVADRVDGREPDVTTVEGYSAFLSCHVKTTNDLCFWTHGTHVVFSENHRNSPGYDIVSNPEKGNCNLFISKAQEGDAGNWYCHVFGNGPIKMELEVKKL